ncbi:hypothetical protein PVL29_014891 [Vitis rotundifolia]|uniref:Protein kinase domain-containing protein n=1 Tax=Vitis rotundifolia TaxID=103349 RepID=A0AA38ZI91_VITRO|nr:hypothetical protein PVL29_014891 [Vitis rotundifolia]
MQDVAAVAKISLTDIAFSITTSNFKKNLNFMGFILLGSGGFRAVYKGVFPNGTIVAVKILSGTSDKRTEEQFMAEVSTIGRIHHLNLLWLHGFCFESSLRALKLHGIAVGTTKGIAYLHEECQQRIIHYDIKLGNILLDSKFNPKVVDFDLARLCNRENNHITMGL